MLLILYDIQSDRLRTRFSKFLQKYGRRIQYSVFEIKNSPRILKNIEIEINVHFEKRFSQGDSVLVYQVGDNACLKRFGYPINEEEDLIIC